MDPEIKKLLDELRAEIGKTSGATQAIDALAKRIEAGEVQSAKVADEIKALREKAAAVEKAMEDFQRQGRVQALRADPIRDRTEGFRMLGMQLRSMAFRRMGQDMPRQFAGEADELARFRATLSADSTGGSYAVPAIVSAELMQAVEDASSILSLCDFRTNLPGKADITTLTGRPALRYKRTTVDTAATQSDPTLGQFSFDPDEMYIYTPIDNRLLQMSAVDLGMEMGPLIIAAAVDGLGYGILNADGTSTYNSMTGLLNEATAGYVSSLPNTKTAFSDVTKGDLTAAKAKALLRAQNIGSWIMSTYILGLCEDFDRTGKREAVTTDNQGVTRLLGNKVVIDAYMPGSAASASATGFAIFGDMKTMFVGLVGGMEIGVSEHVRFDKNQTVIRLVLNGQYQRKPFAGLITVKTAAA